MIASYYQLVLADLGHQPQVGYVVVGVNAGVVIQVVHVFVDERDAVVGVTLGVGAVAGAGVIADVGSHDSQGLLDLGAFRGIEEFYALLKCRHELSLRLFRFLHFFAAFIFGHKINSS